MFKSIQRVVYKVSNLEEAKNWYSRLLDKEPSFTSPFAVTFDINDSGLTLVPDAAQDTKKHDDVMVYWVVDDIYYAYKNIAIII